MTAAAHSIYRERIIDHYRHPRNFGSLAHCDAHCRETNHSCGDDLEFFVKLKDGRLADVRFQGEGCALSVAAASMLTEKAVGMDTKEIADLNDQDVIQMLGTGELTGSRLRCATLGLKGIQKAVADARPGAGKSGKGKNQKKKKRN